MKKVCLCFVLVLGSLLGFGDPASAVIGTIDAVPAATLLLPYFEVDIANSNGANTMFSINNASDLAVLAHVTVWTDQSVPVLGFDVYLTGYDVQRISLRDIFVDGNLPVTASAGQDPNDTISPHGPVSQDSSFARCWSLPYPSPVINALFRAHLQAWLQGNPSPVTGNCAGSKQNDNILRGYITVDTVNSCNFFSPADWAFYAPYLTDQNVLWGDAIYSNPDQGPAQGDALVHIEACANCFVPGDHTFYGRYNGATAADAREPLPTTMAVRFELDDTDGGTDFLVWREADTSASGYSCTLQGPASWYPLGFTQILIFDEQEQPASPCGESEDEPESACLPNGANRVGVSAGLQSPFNSGWAYLNLQHFAIAYADPYAQMWLTTSMDPKGLFSAGLSGIQLDNANAPVTNYILVP